MLDRTNARPSVDAGGLLKARLRTGPTKAIARASYRTAWSTRRILGVMEMLDSIGLSGPGLGRRHETSMLRQSADKCGYVAPKLHGDIPSAVDPAAALPSCARKTMRTMAPMIGTSEMSCHQPLRFVSCSRRVAAAIEGRIVTRPKTELATLLSRDRASPPCQYDVRHLPLRDQ